MRLVKQCIACATGLVLSISLSAATVTVWGIKLEDMLDIRGSALQLNGAGVRYKTVFKVYVAALYLGKKVSTPEELLAAAGPKRMTVTMLREIDSVELGRAFVRGFEDNTPRSEAFRLSAQMFRMGQIFAEQKKLLPGESFSIDWIPGTGTVISVKGKPQGEPFKEVEFFNALMRIWLGPVPADWKLKEALLGNPGMQASY
jgi:Chalcone isomerase-like